jgi:hypothetical protein
MQESTEIDSTILSNFLHRLAHDIENGDAREDEIKRVRTLFFTEEMLNDENFESFKEEDFLDFLTMGWYIYKYILSE